MAQATENIPNLQQDDALLVIDMQSDFLPGGALAVAEGDQVVAPLNRYIQSFHKQDLPIFASRDWHPADHNSFKAQGGPWPPHCVQGTPGAEFVEALQFPAKVCIISKGYRAELEGYSAFEETDLDKKLREAGVRRLFVGGLATEYCVFQTVKEAREHGYDVWLLEDAVRAVNVEADDGIKAIAKMKELGAHTLGERLE